MNHLLAVTFSDILTTVANWVVGEGLRIVVALVVFLIYCQIVKCFCKRIGRYLQKKRVDETIKKVSLPWLKRILIFIGFACVLAYLGVETSTIAAAITSVGLTIGLALQGSLSNLAGGVIIIVMRPYRIGDYIECDGNGGTVEEIKLFYTYLRSPDNKVIAVPNGVASNTTVVNYSVKDTRRNDLIFSISYENDFEKAKRLILECIENNELILKDPLPFINIKEHSSNAISILARYYTKSDDFWTAHWYMLEAVKKAFDSNGITIPYPQLDVHIKN
ncbi:MAG: mechanosensitive ion channel [Clostridia bacterium]|nr:mechanosensitive ion channel [Clostridia bacterium]MDE7328779.1 mechanosensitive ion channel [Clostridia bacterium]